ncbi:replication factor A protein 3 [Basidiobolus meristosporus CBS 931.73]|uniref:Replication factor A protein 3 n=1 Tax=Basidiobolus meristosporus CBS 931.73 TaxID=1314790 RepID=A0A1Y1YC96_9FUNG|nr:replication factor A protein 3 [Basidiobolus meristosporus CBS 931.73]|eukprot:ORX95555.1 replication factor A protein 3 [Basidiobolus meristosporus CBS 931.73]
MDKPTPRINSSMLGQHTNKTVRIVGKVMQLQEGSALIESSDHGQISVSLNPGTTFSTPYVEIIGIVQQDLSVQELTSSGFGENFDLDNYNSLVELSRKYTEIF